MFFTLEVKYNGHFISNPEMHYVGGQVVHFNDIAPDFMSLYELREMLKLLKVPINMPVRYITPEDEYRLVIDDDSVMEMFGSFRDELFLKLYVGDLLDSIGNGDSNEDQNVSNREGNTQGDDMGIREGHKEVHNGDELYVDSLSDESDSENTEASDESTNVGSDLEYFLDGDRLDDSCDPIKHGERLDGANTTIDLGECAAYAKLISEEFMAFISSRKEKRVNEPEYISDSEVLEVVANSSDEEKEISFPVFNEKDMDNPDIKVGLFFTTVDLYRRAVRMYSIRRGFELKFIKNDKDKLTSICKRECGWRIHASSFRKSTTIQVKSIKGVPHRCPWAYRNRSANCKWLASTYLKDLADNPEWKARSFRKTVKKQFKLVIGKMQAYRAKKSAEKKIQGDYKDQYLGLRGYCATIIDKNPGSIALLRTEQIGMNKNPAFKRMFLMFNAQIQGFIHGCRPVIGLDACHLKGVFGGQFMHAVGRDANNQMFPLAMAWVESECKDSWSWFLDILVCHIGTPAEKGWIFISDRQKGLVETFEDLFPGVEHRFCVRHLYANFKLKFKDKPLRDMLWAAARAYLPSQWEKKMNELKVADLEAYKWLNAIPAPLWARSFFNPNAKCDLLSNNISECFNHYIGTTRNEPILTMCESIRRLIMCRFQEKREWIAKVKGDICPRIYEKLEEIKGKACGLEAHRATQGVYEVLDMHYQFIVNVERRSCTCREWDLTGIPCVHACAAFITYGIEASEFVHPYYAADAYKKAYEGIIMPVGDRTLWANAEGDKIDPPVIRKRPGRPKKLRRKGADEIGIGSGSISGKVIKKGTVNHCSRCKQGGHTFRTCKFTPKTSEVQQEVPGTRGSVTIGVDSAGVFTPASRISIAQSNAGRTKANVAQGQFANRGRGGRGNGGKGRAVRNRGGRRGSSRSYGPSTGFGIWNGIGMSTMTNFIPNDQFSTSLTRGSTSQAAHVQPTLLWSTSSNLGTNMSANNAPSSLSGLSTNETSSAGISRDFQVQRQTTGLGTALFSSQVTSSGFHVHQDK